MNETKPHFFSVLQLRYHSRIQTVFLISTKAWWWPRLIETC